MCIFWLFWLTSIEVDENNCHFCSQNGVLFSKDFTTLIAYPPAKSERIYNIPSAVTSIGEWAFSGCSSLTSITLPASLTSIDIGAFEKCSSLTSITLPDSLTYIGVDAFEKCSSLTSITIPRNCKCPDSFNNGPKVVRK